MKLLVLSLLFVSCTSIKRYKPMYKNPHGLRDERIERCVHKLIDKGVKFSEAATLCEERIYAKRTI